MKISALNFMLFFAIFFPTVYGQEPISEKELFRAIKKGNQEIIDKFLNQGNDVNGYYGRKATTLLALSIKRKSFVSFNYLLSAGADPNKPSGQITPINHTIRNNQQAMMEMLLRRGADIDAVSVNGNTALICATLSGKLKFVKTLIEWGADASIRNLLNYNALDYANYGNHRTIAEYLAKQMKLRQFFADMPAKQDGPHIEWLNDTSLRMFYLKEDSLKKYPILRCEYLKANEGITTLEGFAGDTCTYLINSKKNKDEWKYKNVDKILALGDIHGNFLALKNFLVSNGIIGKNLDWTWGDGHLVLLGDLFDRGDQVTETLWLVHQLDIKSRKYGGRVHMLLGNHEIMAMINDFRYACNKYKLLSYYFSKEYADFYNQQTELGQWLRTKNTIININDVLFSHAGISPELVKNHLSIPRINFLIQNFLAKEPNAPNRYPDETNLILGKYGPLWFRGYMYDFDGVPKISQNEVNRVLKTYDAKKIVIAHSHVEHISGMFENQVISIEVPLNESGIISEGLLIENGEYFRLLPDGTKIKMFDR
ncbi:MAG: hypothetical protein EOM06_05035 [Sphingobacteriia bacterium]|nr:hypothetical protein [Sphingobacteriia bacterium]